MGRVKKPNIEKGKKLFGEFHGFDSSQVSHIKLETSIPKTLVKIGVLREILYHSDKDQPGRLHRYIHDFKKPWPILCCDVEGKKLFIVGGNFKVKPEGIVS